MLFRSGEQLPGAFQMAAQAMGVTTAELNKMLEMGEVVSEDFLPKFAKVLHERFGKAAVKNAELARGAFNRFGNEVEYTKRSLANAGFTEFFADLARSATASLEEIRKDLDNRKKDITEYMKEISDSADIAFKSLDVKDIVEDLERVAESVKSIKKTIGGLITLYKAVPEIANKGLIVLLLGSVSKVAGVAAGLGMITSSLKDAYEGVIAFTEGGISLSGVFDTEKFGEELQHFRDLQDLSDGLLETEKEINAAIDLKLMKLNKIKKSGSTAFGGFNLFPTARSKKEKEQINSLKAELEELYKVKEKIQYLDSNKKASAFQIQMNEDVIVLQRFEKNLKEAIIQKEKLAKAQIYIAVGQQVGADPWIAKEKELKEVAKRVQKYQEQQTQFEYDEELKRIKNQEKVIEIRLKNLAGMSDQVTKWINEHKEKDDWITDIKIANLKEVEEARVEATIKEIEAMNAMVAKEKEVYSWLKEIKVRNALEAIETVEEARVAATVKEIDEMNAMVAQEKIIYQEYLAWSVRIKVDAIVEGEEARSKAFQSEIEDWNKIIAKEKEVYDWLKKIRTDNARDTVKQEETDSSNKWQKEIKAMNDSIAEEKRVLKEYNAWVVSIRIEGIRQVEVVRHEAWQGEIEEMNAVIAKEKEIFDWLNGIKTLNTNEANVKEETDRSNKWQIYIKEMNDVIAKEKSAYESFQSDYKQATMSTTAYELDQLNQRYDEYAKTITDKTKLDEWYAIEQGNIIEDNTTDWSEAFSGWAASYSSTLNDMIWDSEFSFKTIGESFARMLTEMQMQKAMSGIMDSVDGINWGGLASSVFGGMFGGGGASLGGGAAAGASSISTGAIFNAGGSVFGMAGGGIINEHVKGIGMSSGASYEFGEAGVPEAVVPKNSWSDKSPGSGGQQTKSTIVHNTFYVTPDQAGNISKKSQHQIARAASRGINMAMGR